MNTLIVSQRYRHTGFSLLTAMVFLIMLTLLAVVAIRSTITQERMISNTQDWNLAFQSAEAALRDAQAEIIAGTRTGVDDVNFTNDCKGSSGVLPTSAGLCRPSESGTPVWKDAAPANDPWWGASGASAVSTQYGAVTGTQPMVGVIRQPRYMIEYLGDMGNSSLVMSQGYTAPLPTHQGYRITAVGFGKILNDNDAPASRVMLQSVFER
ncbi:MAG: hypothetical protein LBE24_09515 [Methylobacillus sp.]|jgi:type IV pilus assembly protein PilX|nr:hypothetical protein [Methylobacillus sp.]